MTTKNSILLIIKQNQGIEYNSLLNKVSPPYGSVNSARAALSRALKDLSALGMVQRRGNNIFITDKGAANINKEMKSKLLLRLNEIVKSGKNVSEIDSIVELLHTLIERSKQDTDLLKAAKGSTEFYVSDLAEIKEKLDKRTAHLNYLSKIFLEQINSLKKMDFNDSKMLRWNEKTVKLLKSLPQKTDSDEFFAECRNKEFLEFVAKKLNAKTQEKNIFLKKSQLPKLLELIEKKSSLEYNAVNIYFSNLKAGIDFPDVYLSGAYSKIAELT